jgi:quinolinate synthase
MRVFTDRKRILEILTHPDIWERVKNGKDIESSTFELPENWVYLTETENEVFILSTSHQIHVNILPDHRRKAYWMCKRFIEWIFMNTNLSEIYLKIHKKHENAINLGALCGFESVNYTNDRLTMVRRFER